MLVVYYKANSANRSPLDFVADMCPNPGAVALFRNRMGRVNFPIFGSGLRIWNFRYTEYARFTDLAFS